MSAGTQTVAALAIVALAAAWLLRRWFSRRRGPGCGGDCACPAEDLRSRAREL